MNTLIFPDSKNKENKCSLISLKENQNNFLSKQKCLKAYKYKKNNNNMNLKKAKIFAENKENISNNISLYLNKLNQTEEINSIKSSYFVNNEVKAEVLNLNAESIITIPNNNKFLKDSPLILNEMNICRICYEAENKEQGMLIAPCACSGSCKFIHETCIKQWIDNCQENSNKINSKCELCKTNFKIKYNTSRKFNLNNIFELFHEIVAESVMFGTFLTIFMCVIFIFVVCLSSLDSDRSKDLAAWLFSAEFYVIIGFIVVITLIKLYSHKLLDTITEYKVIDKSKCCNKDIVKDFSEDFRFSNFN